MHKSELIRNQTELNPGINMFVYWFAGNQLELGVISWPGSISQILIFFFFVINVLKPTYIIKSKNFVSKGK